MHDRFLRITYRFLLAALLIGGSGPGAYAQCSGPFALDCRAEVNAVLDANCTYLVRPAVVLSGLPECLADSNFLITVIDAVAGNDNRADRPGRFQYTVTGRHHPALANFSCSGFITLSDLTPPDIALSASLVDRGCDQRNRADVNQLPADASNCWRIDGATSLPEPGTFDGRLARALRAGGGIPAISDACGSDVEVCVNDVFNSPPNTVCTDTIILQRSFIARALGTDNSVPAIQIQTVRFIRPRVPQLSGVAEVVLNNCPGAPVFGNSPPSASHYPYLTGATGTIHINEGFCELDVDYVDGPLLPGCNGNYSFVRSFRVRDNCAGGTDSIFPQIIYVGDFSGPVIQAPTQDLDDDGTADEGPLRFFATANCSGVIDLRSGATVSDACGNGAILDVRIYPGQDLSLEPLGPYRVIGGPTTLLSEPLPIGSHLLRYEARDNCGNRTEADVVVVIEDDLAPLPVCVAQRTVVLNGAGFSTLPATAFDAGSTDECGALSFTVARAGADGNAMEAFAPQLSLNCTDINAAVVVLRVTDDAGNTSDCTAGLSVTDLSPPQCTPPPAVTLNCYQYTQQFPADLATALAAEPAIYEPLLDGAFGVALPSDNCDDLVVTQTLTGVINECGVGQFIRSFTVTDAGGNNQQGTCQQVLSVTPYHEYSLRLPGDGVVTCGELPQADDILLAAPSCNLLAVNTFRDTLPAPDGGCFALRLSYEVINWCEYDGQSAALVIPRDANGDGSTEQPTFLHIVPNGDDAADDTALLDQDHIPGNANDLSPLTFAYGTAAGRGFFVYEQFATINDNTPPELSVAPSEAGLAFTEDCRGGVTVTFTATDDCGETATAVTIDEFAVDRDNDGVYDGFDFAGAYDIPPSRFEGEPATGVDVPVRNLPIGLHLARVTTTDGCGNQAVVYSLLRVEDGRTPAVTCLSVATVELAADPVSGGINYLGAGDLLIGQPQTCTPSAFTYSVYREEEAAVSGFIPQPGVTEVAFDCADLGDNILRLYAFAEATGRSGFCNSIVIVTDEADLCADRMGVIDGLILDPNGEPVRNAEVFLNSSLNTEAEITEGDGLFFFDGLTEGTDYNVRPYLNSNPLNGLSTADLNIIGRRLIGIDEGLTPYQLIAADANNNGNITIHDLLMIREVILGVEDGFDNNTSWRFVDAEYAFPDPADPWVEDFPETVDIADLQGMASAHFVAIKIGDVSGNANPQHNFGQQTEAAGRSAGATLSLRAEKDGSWGLYIPEQERGAAAGAGEGYTAVQAALRLPPGTRVLAGAVAPEEFHVTKDDVLRISHLSGGSAIRSDLPLLRFAVPTGSLPELIDGPDELRPEAYTADFSTVRLGLRIDYGARPEPAITTTMTAAPNPFDAATSLQYDWPVTEPVWLDMYNASGQLVNTTYLTAITGSNTHSLGAADLGIQRGAFMFRLRGAEGREAILRVIRR